MSFGGGRSALVRSDRSCDLLSLRFSKRGGGRGESVDRRIVPPSTGFSGGKFYRPRRNYLKHALPRTTTVVPGCVVHARMRRPTNRRRRVIEQCNHFHDNMVYFIKKKFLPPFFARPPLLLLLLLYSRYVLRAKDIFTPSRRTRRKRINTNERGFFFFLPEYCSDIIFEPYSKINQTETRTRQRERRYDTVYERVCVSVYYLIFIFLLHGRRTPLFAQISRVAVVSQRRTTHFYNSELGPQMKPPSRRQKRQFLRPKTAYNYSRIIKTSDDFRLLFFFFFPIAFELFVNFRNVLLGRHPNVPERNVTISNICRNYFAGKRTISIVFNKPLLSVGFSVTCSIFLTQRKNGFN